MRASLLVVAALFTSIVVYACGITGSVETTGEVTLPGGTKCRWSGEVAVDGSQMFSLFAGPTAANLCVETTFRGADGVVTGSSVSHTAGDGSFSTSVPSGSTLFEAKIVDCPEEESGSDQSGQNLSFSSQVSGLDKAGSSKLGPRLDSASLPPVLVIGGPLVADSTPGDWNQCYGFLVRAKSFEEAEAIIRPIVEGGIGSKVPPTVTVLQFSSTTADASGCRVLEAVPGEFVEWSLDFNDGAFYADLFTNSIRHHRNGWDIVETVIPSMAMDSGVLPGVTYTNKGEVVYEVDYVPGTLGSAFSYSYSN